MSGAMRKRVSDSDKLNRILAIMKMLQSHIEESNFEITEFEEVEIFLDLAIVAGRKATKLNDPNETEHIVGEG